MVLEKADTSGQGIHKVHSVRAPSQSRSVARFRVRCINHLRSGRVSKTEVEATSGPEICIACGRVAADSILDRSETFGEKPHIGSCRNVFDRSRGS